MTQLQQHAQPVLTDSIAVVLLSAKDLPLMDGLNPVQGAVQPCAQCKISLKTANWTDTGTVVKSQTVNRSQNPKWQEEFLFSPVPADSKYAVIDVFHRRSMVEDQFIGRAVVPLADISSAERITDVELTNYKSRSKARPGQALGHLNLAVFRLSDDVFDEERDMDADSNLFISPADDQV